VRLTEIGEFGLIDRITRIVNGSKPDIVVGIGDDAAVVRSDLRKLKVLTTDVMVEGIHFNLAYTPFESLGWKALATTISDVAAMGGIPLYGLVSLALPVSWNVENVELLYKGLKRCGDVYQCTLVGGDTVQSQGMCFISVAVMGEIEEGSVVRRNGAKEKDLICVTGELGGATVGFEVLESGQGKDNFPDSVSRFLEPKVRLQESQQLVKEMHVSSMIDISDGLSSEITHLCQQSDCGCIIWEDQIPVSKEAIFWSRGHEKAISAYALKSGEEYELLFTVARTEFEKWRNSTKNKKNVLNITVIGEITRKEEGICSMKGGKKKQLVPDGWDHFHK